MKKLSSFLERIASWKVLLTFLGLYLLFPAYILKNVESKINELAGAPVTVIDLTFGFNPEETLAMVAGYGEAARSYYATTEMTTDILYPIVYAFLFGMVLTLLFRSGPYSRVNTIPFVCLLLDYLENISIVVLLTTFPDQSFTVAVLCEIFKLLKWLTFGSIILLVIIGLISKLVRRPKSVEGIDVSSKAP